MGGHHSNTTQRHLKGLVTPFFEVSWGCPSYVQKGTSNAAFVETKGPLWSNLLLLFLTKRSFFARQIPGKWSYNLFCQTTKKSLLLVTRQELCGHTFVLYSRVWLLIVAKSERAWLFHGFYYFNQCLKLNRVRHFTSQTPSSFFFLPNWISYNILKKLMFLLLFNTKYYKLKQYNERAILATKNWKDYRKGEIIFLLYKKYST
jgi:hypothetical protein